MLPTYSDSFFEEYRNKIIDKDYGYYTKKDLSNDVIKFAIELTKNNSVSKFSENEFKKITELISKSRFLRHLCLTKKEIPLRFKISALKETVNNKEYDDLEMFDLTLNGGSVLIPPKIMSDILNELIHQKEFSHSNIKFSPSLTANIFNCASEFDLCKMFASNIKFKVDEENSKLMEFKANELLDFLINRTIIVDVPNIQMENDKYIINQVLYENIATFIHDNKYFSDGVRNKAFAEGVSLEDTKNFTKETFCEVNNSLSEGIDKFIGVEFPKLQDNIYHEKYHFINVFSNLYQELCNSSFSADKEIINIINEWFEKYDDMYTTFICDAFTSPYTDVAKITKLDADVLDKFIEYENPLYFSHFFNNTFKFYITPAVIKGNEHYIIDRFVNKIIDEKNTMFENYERTMSRINGDIDTSNFFDEKNSFVFDSILRYPLKNETINKLSKLYSDRFDLAIFTSPVVSPIEKERIYRERTSHSYKPNDTMDFLYALGNLMEQPKYQQYGICIAEILSGKIPFCKIDNRLYRFEGCVDYCSTTDTKNIIECIETALKTSKVKDKSILGLPDDIKKTFEKAKKSCVAYNDVIEIFAPSFNEHCCYTKSNFSYKAFLDTLLDSSDEKIKEIINSINNGKVDDKLGSLYCKLDEFWSTSSLSICPAEEICAFINKTNNLIETIRSINKKKKLHIEKDVKKFRELEDSDSTHYF